MARLAFRVTATEPTRNPSRSTDALRLRQIAGAPFKSALPWWVRFLLSMGKSA